MKIIPTFNFSGKCEEALKLYKYDVLKEGSKTIYPLEKTFYSALRVVFTDKFGFRWGLMAE